MNKSVRKNRREMKEKKAQSFNQKSSKGMTPYRGRSTKHRGDLFSHMDDELKY